MPAITKPLAPITPPSKAATAVHIIQSTINIAFLIWATVIVGFALPLGHKYHGGWIFGLAWFPIILFTALNFATMSLLPKRFIKSILSFLTPYAFIALNIYRGENITLENFIVQSAMLQFSTMMVGYALQAVVFPILYKTTGDRSTFINTEVIPQMFAVLAGIGMCWYEFNFLLNANVLTTSDLPLLFLGMLQGGITVGIALHRARNL